MSKDWEWLREISLLIERAAWSASESLRLLGHALDDLRTTPRCEGRVVTMHMGSA